MPNGLVPTFPGPFGISTRRTGGARYVPAFNRAQISWTRVSNSRSNSVIVSPSTPLAPRRFICRQVSLRNSGVSKCASDVKRSVRSVLALAAICSSCVGIRLLLLSVGDVSLAQNLDLFRRFPLCTAFPCAEYYQRIRLPRQRLPSYGWSIQSAYSGRR